MKIAKEPFFPFPVRRQDQPQQAKENTNGDSYCHANDNQGLVRSVKIIRFVVEPWIRTCFDIDKRGCRLLAGNGVNDSA